MSFTVVVKLALVWWTSGHMSLPPPKPVASSFPYVAAMTEQLRHAQLLVAQRSADPSTPPALLRAGQQEVAELEAEVLAGFNVNRPPPVDVASHHRCALS